MSAQHGGHLLVIGDRQALAWVLTTGSMAFPTKRFPNTAPNPGMGARVLLYTSRGCFRNPGRDRGRVIADATVITPPKALDPAPAFGGRTFTEGCTIDIHSLAPFGEGVDLAEEVPNLHCFPIVEHWNMRLRRSPVVLDAHDFQHLQRRLKKVARPLDEAVAEYVRRGVPPAKQKQHQAS